MSKFDDVKDEINKDVNKASEITEGAIDPWLVEWAKSEFSMPIAVGFGIALLLIGYAVGKVF